MKYSVLDIKEHKILAQVEITENEVSYCYPVERKFKIPNANHCANIITHTLEELLSNDFKAMFDYKSRVYANAVKIVPSEKLNLILLRNSGCLYEDEIITHKNPGQFIRKMPIRQSDNIKFDTIVKLDYHGYVYKTVNVDEGATIPYFCLDMTECYVMEED